jgi:hypothetical protein
MKWELLHGGSSANVRERAGGKTTLYSVGYIFGFKLRQTLRMVDESEMEAYISHLRNVLAARECDSGRLVEVIAWLCEMYVLKESEKTSRRIAKLREERVVAANHSQQSASSGIRLRVRNQSCIDEDGER